MAVYRQGIDHMTVDEIFEDAIKKFKYQSDLKTFGTIEYWATIKELESASTPKTFIGDCDDFAAWCVNKLRVNGYAARFVLCQCETGEYHCVAETDGMILDNRQLCVTQLNDLLYTWHTISGYNAGDPWLQILKD